MTTMTSKRTVAAPLTATPSWSRTMRIAAFLITASSFVWDTTTASSSTTTTTSSLKRSGTTSSDLWDEDSHGTVTRAPFQRSSSDGNDKKRLRRRTKQRQRQRRTIQKDQQDQPDQQKETDQQEEQQEEQQDEQEQQQEEEQEDQQQEEQQQQQEGEQEQQGEIVSGNHGDDSLLSDENRIVGGQIAANTGKEYPFFVHTGRCGGSLVAPDVVMTAAHCAPTIGSTVLVGAVDRYDDSVGGAERVRVISGTQQRHPQYNLIGDQNRDVMIFRIERPSTDRRLAQLNTRDSVPSTGSTVTVIGVGATNSRGTEYGPHLRWVDIDAVSYQYCQKQYGFIKDGTMLCAGNQNRSQKKDSCYGDSGGPLLARDGTTQVGIVSFGADCADPDYPGVYTRISGVADWLLPAVCDLSGASDELDFCNGGYGSDSSGSSSSNNNGGPSWSSSYGNGNGKNDGSRTDPKLKFSIIVQYNKYPKQSGWSINERHIHGKLVTRSPPGSVKQSNARIIRNSIHLKPGTLYALTMTDTSGTGPRGGYIEIVAKKGKKQVWKRRFQGNFKTKKRIIKFKVPKRLSRK